ncbi:hypothetical protein EHQ27_15240 [Leptospira wolffii]|uniref:hypothetical protein n=1 Tax=Leptospira wolffii TaxID=409998 RepID=UPI0010845793|nr:hypothetical protein [Leptospira wolffii]TGK62770.1 hypothetical protein EHQ32_08190 [Leptospira wolffii]TGK67698.1 hypothetical protein EHQ27_15240 [Leptospira wolffii]TGK73843.1 hypothetical protein EHQ35_05575 [Leptospira wolffii]TGL28705.1 hypothetical protein EHQ57_12100 [Leptospira wolffii]
MKSLYKKIRILFILGILTSFYSLGAQSKTLPYPIWGQSLGVYNAVYISGEAKDYRDSSDYGRNRKISLDAEMKLGNYFSVTAGYGYVDQYFTQSTSWSGWDRWKAGMKAYYKFGIFSLGAGVSVFGPSVSEPWTGERNPDFLLARPQLGFGLDFGRLKFQAYALYERERDSQWKEPIQEKHYRYMEAGGTLSYETEIGLILLMETTYRMAVEDTVSARSDSFNLHPGVQIPLGENGRFVLGGLIGMREKNTYDQGFKIGYQHFFP